MAKEYDIAKTTGQCSSCEKVLAGGEDFVATLVEADADAEEQFRRCDYCCQCWEARGRDEGGAFCVWRSRVPQPQEKKKLFVDDSLLINFFQRLEGDEKPGRVSLRFVLALVLMRKKLLVYDGTTTRPDGTELWKMRLKGTDETHEVSDPKMDEEKIAEVSRHLGEILEGEL